MILDSLGILKPMMELELNLICIILLHSIGIVTDMVLTRMLRLVQIPLLMLQRECL